MAAALVEPGPVQGADVAAGRRAALAAAAAPGRERRRGGRHARMTAERSRYGASLSIKHGPR